MGARSNTSLRMRAALVFAVGVGALLLAAAALAAPTTTATKATSVKAKTFAAVRALCPQGSKPAFGGFEADFSRSGGALPTGMTASGRAWRFGAANITPDPHSIRSIAYCSKHPAFSVRSKSKNVPKLKITTVTAACPSGTTLLAGGYRGETDATDANPRVFVTSMRRIGTRSLAVTAVNGSSTDAGSATAIAYCGDGPRPSAHAFKATVPGDGTGTARARCPGETSLVFGGFVASAKFTNIIVTPRVTGVNRLVVPKSLSRTSGGAWQVIGVNATLKIPGKITSIAYCS
jgi:hypothetical protein